MPIDRTKQPGQYPVFDYISNLFSGQDASAAPSSGDLDQEFERGQRVNDRIAMGDYENELGKMASTPNPMPSLSRDLPFQPGVETVDIPASGSLGSSGARRPAAPAPAPREAVSRAIADRMGFGKDLDADALKAAQGQSADRAMMAQIGEGADQIGYAIAGGSAKSDPSFYRNLAQTANRPVENLMERRKAKLQDVDAQSKMAENDPSSELSQNLRTAYRPMLAKMGLSDEMIENASASDLKNFFQHPVETAAKLKSMEEQKAIQMEAVKAQKELANGFKTDKRFTSLGEALDENRQRSGEFGRQAQFVNNADRALVLGKQFKDGNLPPAQVAELASAVASMVSGGSHAAEGTINRFVPKTGSGVAADVEQWLTGNPKGAGQQAFVKMMLETAEREKHLAASKVNAIKLSRVADFRDLSQSDPERFNIALQSHGIDPKDYAAFQAGGYKVPSGMQAGNLSAEDEAAINWAKTNPTDPRAAKILSLHGL